MSSPKENIPIQLLVIHQELNLKVCAQRIQLFCDKNAGI